MTIMQPSPCRRGAALLMTAVASCCGAADVSVSDPAVVAGLSPSNWVVAADAIGTGVGGASLIVGFEGTRHVALKVDTSRIAVPDATRYPIIAWSVDGGPLHSHQLMAGETSIPLCSDAADPVIDLFVKGMCPWINRYDGDPPPNSVTITGFTIDHGGRAVAAPQPKGVWLSIGDSITAGDGAALAENQGRPQDSRWAEADDARASYAWRLARHFGYRESRLAYGGYNWTGGLANVPPLVTLIDQKTSRASRLTGDVLAPLPDVVTVNLGTNGRPRPDDVAAALTAVRKRSGPRAALIVMVPFNGGARAEVTAGFDAYVKGSGDERAHLVDLGEVAFATCDGVHPTAAGHETLFEKLLPAMEPLVESAARR